MSPPSSEGPRCPVCGKKRVQRFRPFCSKRCADIDLGRWLKGGYAVPGRDGDEGDSLPGSGPGNEEE